MCVFIFALLLENPPHTSPSFMYSVFIPPSLFSLSPTSFLTHTDRHFWDLPLERGRGWLGRRLRSAVWRSPPARQRGGCRKHNQIQQQTRRRRHPPRTTFSCWDQLSLHWSKALHYFHLWIYRGSLRCRAKVWTSPFKMFSHWELWAADELICKMMLSIQQLKV